MAGGYIQSNLDTYTENMKLCKENILLEKIKSEEILIIIQ
jgi:hypothetical protein